MMSFDGIKVAQTVGITAAMAFAGFNWTYSFALIPAILFQSQDTSEEERQLLARWRKVYNTGYRVSGPVCLLSAALFGSLAWLSNSYSTSARNKYIAAAVLLPSVILVHTFIHMRSLLGALCLRAVKLAPDSAEGTRAEGLAKGEARTIEIENTTSTKEMVRLWGKYNLWRSLTGLAGALLATYASLELSSELGAATILFA